MRQSRRGCFYQNKASGYVWAVYNIGQTLDESTVTTGSFTLSSTRTKMASSTYTYSGSTFTLTNSTSTTAANLSVGKYIVSVTTSSNSSTSGTYLYLITGKSGSSSYTFQYKRYSSLSDAKGTTYYYDVQSETLDYPINGVYGDYWYVLISAPTQYIWDVYEYTYGLVDSTAETGSNKKTSTTSIVIGKSYSHYISDVLGDQFNLNETSTTTYSAVQVGDYTFFGTSAGSTSTSLYVVTGVSTSMGQTTITYKRYFDKGNIRGDAIIDRVYSNNLGDYPMDGVKGSYWYVLLYAGDVTESKYVWDVYTISNNAAGDYVIRIGSNTKDYPVNGVSDTYWYTMVKGEYSVYVWDEYIKVASGYKAVHEDTIRLYDESNNGLEFTSYPSYSFNSTTGKFSSSGTATTTEFQLWDSGAGNYKYSGVPTGRYNVSSTQALYYGSGTLNYRWNSEGTAEWYVQISVRRYTAATNYIKGTATGNTVESQDILSYPTNGELGDYWYVYSYTYSVPFNNLE